jgi:hypothetical protein
MPCVENINLELGQTPRNESRSLSGLSRNKNLLIIQFPCCENLVAGKGSEGAAKLAKA